MKWGRYCFCVAEGSGGAAVMDRLVFGPTGAMNTVLAVWVGASSLSLFLSRKSTGSLFTAFCVHFQRSRRLLVAYDCTSQ